MFYKVRNKSEFRWLLFAQWFQRPQRSVRQRCHYAECRPFYRSHRQANSRGLGSQSMSPLATHCGTEPKRHYHDENWSAKMVEIGLQPSSSGEIGGKVTGQHISQYIIPDGRLIKPATS